jgi:hypothetical protein
MKNVALAAAVTDLAALLEYAGRCEEALRLRREAQVLPLKRTPSFAATVRGGIFVARQAIPVEAREAAGDVVTRIRLLSKN